MVIKDGHVTSQQTTVPTTTTSTNAGTGATSSVSSATDVAGILNLISGTGNFTAGIQVTVNFNKVYSVAPIVSLTEANANASANKVSQQIFISSTTSGFSVQFGVAQTVASQPYIWHYNVIETQ